MKFTIPQSVLKLGLERVASAIRPSTVPLLEHVALTTSGAGTGRLRLVGTSPEFTLTVDLPCRVEAEGTVALPATQLRELVRALPDGPVQIELVASQRAVITAGASRAELVGLSGHDYPAPPLVQYGEQRLPAPLLLALVDRTAFAAAPVDGSLGPLNGVLVRMRDDTVHAYATDKFRLARATFRLSAPATARDAIVLPRVLDAVKRAFTDAAEVSIGFGEDGVYRIGFRAPGVELVANVLEGVYPDCERVLRPDSSARVRVDRQALAAELTRVLVFANAQTHRVEFTLEGNAIRLRAKEPDRGEIRGEVAVERLAGGDLYLAVNGRFLHDLLMHLASPIVELGLHGSTAPIVLAPVVEPGSGETLRFVLMPLRATE